MLGALGAVFSSPCATPVLVAVLAVVAKGASAAAGAVLLLSYSAGHSLLIIASGVSAGFIKQALQSGRFAKAESFIKTVFAVLLLMVAFYLLFSFL